MTMLHATNDGWRTVVHNRQILANRKWKFLYVTLPLLAAGNVVAMESNRSTSEHSRRPSLSNVTSLDEGINSESIECYGKKKNLQAQLDESQNSSSIRAEPSESPKKISEHEQVIRLKRELEKKERELEKKDRLIKLLNEQRSSSEYEQIISKLKRELEEKDKQINKLSNEKKNAIKQRIPMGTHELSRLPKKNVRITEHSGDNGDIIYTLIIEGKIFGESTNEEDLYREFFSYYNISMPTSLKEKFNAFMEFQPEERAKHINKKQNDTVIREIEEREEYRKRLIRYIGKGNKHYVQKLAYKLNHPKKKELTSNEKVEQTTSISFDDIVNLPDNQSGHTLLWEAVSAGNIDIVGILLGNGADAMIKDENGNSSLTTAIDKIEDEDDKKFICELLKEYGADINTNSGDADTYSGGYIEE